MILCWLYNAKTSLDKETVIICMGATHGYRILSQTPNPVGNLLQ